MLKEEGEMGICEQRPGSRGCSECEVCEQVQPSAMPTDSPVELADGEPCGHPGCLHHISHPCEGCGRIGGKR